MLSKSKNQGGEKKKKKDSRIASPVPKPSELPSYILTNPPYKGLILNSLHWLQLCAPHKYSTHS